MVDDLDVSDPPCLLVKMCWRFGELGHVPAGLRSEAASGAQKPVRLIPRTRCGRVAVKLVRARGARILQAGMWAAFLSRGLGAGRPLDDARIAHPTCCTPKAFAMETRWPGASPDSGSRIGSQHHEEGDQHPIRAAKVTNQARGGPPP